MSRLAAWTAMTSAALLPACSMFSTSEPDPVQTRSTAQQAATRQARPEPESASGRAIQPNVLMVNSTPITIDEVLYLIRRPVALAKAEGRTAGLEDQVTRWVLEVTQQSLGTVLLEAEARRELTEQQLELVDKYVAKEVDAQVARGFGGSRTRFADHLARFGMSLAQYEKIVARTTLAQQYTRERFMPMIHLRRSELIDYYEANVDRYTEPELRELFMIAIPYASQLPPRRTWTRSTEAQREAARRSTRERIFAAQQALRSGRPFDEVAKEYGADAMAPLGGAWGPIGEPLREPYAEPSQRLFTLPPQGVSNPIQNDQGWYIVKCGQVEGGQRPRFDEIQARMRAELTDERLGELTNQYMADLARKSSLSSVEPFVRAATARAMQANWPPVDPQKQS
jgi:hypothetical protein